MVRDAKLVRVRALARLASGLLFLALASGAPAGVLPEDRADVLYHSYDGGGVTIDGPSFLVRKEFAGKFSAAANYYVDNVSSASIDVVTSGASPYEEERTQYSLGLDYLRDRWTFNLGMSSSVENDFEAETVSLGISQDLFGDLTTVSLGYTLGDDVVMRRGDSDFLDTIQRQHYRLGVSQILTPNLLLGFSFESITDEGFLNNPYRTVRYLDGDSAIGYSRQPEAYPRTRTSDAASLRLRYYLPYRAALHWEYRSYGDTWHIDATTVEMSYTHPLTQGVTLEARVRAYTQESADFYSDLFPYEDAANFIARDKELSTFDSSTFRIGVTYDILESGWRFIERGSVSLFYDHMLFEYQDFRDLRNTAGMTPGTEPLYEFNADVIQIFVSFWL
jgi:hypothetical protein